MCENGHVQVLAKLERELSSSEYLQMLVLPLVYSATLG